MIEADFYNLDSILQELICPLTQEIMKDPVIIESGHTYDRSFIQSWFNRGNNTNPITGLPLTSIATYPNISLKNMIQKIPKLKEKINVQQKNISEMQELLKAIQQMWNAQAPQGSSRIKKEKNLLQEENLILKELLGVKQKQINYLKSVLESFQRLNQPQTENQKSRPKRPSTPQFKQPKIQSSVKYPLQKLFWDESFKRPTAYSWAVDPEFRNFGQMDITGNKITAKNSTIVFGKNRIMNYSSFTIKFTKIHNYVGLGVCSAQDKARIKYSAGDYVQYKNNGYWYSGGHIQNGSPFSVGETVTMIIDLNSAQILWKVGNQLRQHVTYLMLKDQCKSWVPFIKLYSYNDSFEVME